MDIYATGVVQLCEASSPTPPTESNAAFKAILIKNNAALKAIAEASKVLSKRRYANDHIIDVARIKGIFYYTYKLKNELFIIASRQKPRIEDIDNIQMSFSVIIRERKRKQSESDSFFAKKLADAKEASASLQQLASKTLESILSKEPDVHVLERKATNLHDTAKLFKKSKPALLARIRNHAHSIFNTKDHDEDLDKEPSNDSTFKKEIA